MSSSLLSNMAFSNFDRRTGATRKALLQKKSYCQNSEQVSSSISRHLALSSGNRLRQARHSCRHRRLPEQVSCVRMMHFSIHLALQFMSGCWIMAIDGRVGVPTLFSGTGMDGAICPYVHTICVQPGGCRHSPSCSFPLLKAASASKKDSETLKRGYCQSHCHSSSFHSLRWLVSTAQLTQPQALSSRKTPNPPP